MTPRDIRPPKHIVQPLMGPAHEIDVWKTTFATAFAMHLDWDINTCAKHADAAVIAVRRVIDERARGVCR
jgi:hypothetical protein